MDKKEEEEGGGAEEEGGGAEEKKPKSSPVPLAVAVGAGRPVVADVRPVASVV